MLNTWQYVNSIAYHNRSDIIQFYWISIENLIQRMPLQLKHKFQFYALSTDNIPIWLLFSKLSCGTMSYTKCDIRTECFFVRSNSVKINCNFIRSDWEHWLWYCDTRSTTIQPSNEFVSMFLSLYFYCVVVTHGLSYMYIFFGIAFYWIESEQIGLD